MTLCTIYETYLSIEIDYLGHIYSDWKGPLVFGWNKTNRNSNEIHFAAEQKQREFFRLFSCKVKQQIKEAKQKGNKMKKVKQNEKKDGYDWVHVFVRVCVHAATLSVSMFIIIFYVHLNFTSSLLRSF